ncbi:MAG TPA: hypothetical protein VFF73_31170 [Planctomycetota bacterium]|nr:hypothetical protein [Planctomycetota bacterium]
MEAEIALDRAAVLVRAPLPDVLAALSPFAPGEPVIDATGSLERGVGVDALAPPRDGGRRALLFKRRGAAYATIIREGDPRAVHDVPLARRLSKVLSAPAVALQVSGSDVTYELFHGGRCLESWLCLSGEVVHAESAFVLDPTTAARDPYGRALAVLAGYGFEDDRLAFPDFARGDLVMRRWDVTIGRAYVFMDLAPWPQAELLQAVA